MKLTLNFEKFEHAEQAYVDQLLETYDKRFQDLIPVPDGCVGDL